MKYPRERLNVVVSSGILLLLTMISRIVFGHEEEAPFSGAIIESLRVHHAHIEDEQRINFSLFDGFRKEGGKRTAFSNSLELAIDWTNEFRIGSEALIPFSNTGLDKGDYGIGDIELWPIKYAFINRPETIFSGVLSFKLPTGSESKGLGEGNTEVGTLFFFDQAYRNWYWGLNAEIATNISDETGSEFEFSSVISYSFIRETGEGIAPPRPRQSIVPALSLEAISESVLSGEDEGKDVVSVLPGFHLWNPKSGWQVRIGVEIPLSADKDNNFAILLQVGNHLDWGRIFRQEGVTRLFFGDT
jgi:hypothetical protein